MASPTVPCDTNVVSILLKVSQVHNDRKARIEQALTGTVVAVGFVTVGELVYWAESRSWGTKRKEELDRRLRSFMILTPSRATAEQWAKIKNECTSKGKQIRDNDLWIAAAAREHGLRLATADGDFDSITGIETIRL